MNILFLTSRFPYPPIGGDKLRAFHIIRHLSKAHNVTVISAYEREEDLIQLSEFKKLVSEVIPVKITRYQSYLKTLVGIIRPHPLQCYYYYSKRLQAYINQKLMEENYDLIFVHLIRMAEYVLPRYRSKSVIDLTDAISLNYERAKAYRSGWFKWVNLLEYHKVKRYESIIPKEFEKAFVISDIDKSYLQDLSQADNLEVLENGVDLDYFYPKNDINSDNRRIIFLGNMRTFPNEDAVLFFSKKIFPMLLTEIQDLEFYIVGANPSRRVKELARYPRINVTGYVSDVRKYLWSALCAVAPIRVGAGVQNKILEAMACGLPVITSPIGNEGINATDREEIFLAESPEEYVRIIKKLISNPVLRMNVGERARSFVKKNFRWEQILKKLDGTIAAHNKRN